MNAPAASAAAADATALRLAAGVAIAADRVEAAVQQETAVIGLLVLHPQRMPRPGALDTGCFVVEQYRRIFGAMQALAAETGTFTPRSLADRCGVPPKLIFAAAAAASSSTTLISLDDHVAELRRAAALRALLDRAHAAVDAGAAGDPLRMAQMLRSAADDLGGLGDDDDSADGQRLAGSLLQHVADIRSGEGRSGVTTGFLALDRVIGGYRPGELVVVAARPGMGKTVFGVASARASAAGDVVDPATGEVAVRSRHSVGFFSLEVGEAQTAARFVADQARAMGRIIPYGALVRGDLSERHDGDLERAADALAGLPIRSAFRPGQTLAMLDARVEAWALAGARSGRPLAVVFIDYLKFLKATDRYRGNRNLEIGEITGGLKELAARRGICVVLLCQLNRQVEGRQERKPTLSDLRDSGEIEQDADAVLMLYREAYYLRAAGRPEDEDRLQACRNDLDVIVEKNRVGECVTVRLWCDVATSSVRDPGWAGTGVTR